MSGDVFLYSILGILALLAVFSFFIGTEKMIKLVIGNYVLIGIILPLSMTLNIAITYFGATPTDSFLGIVFTKRQTFFINGQVTIVLLTYIASLLLLFTQSTLSISLPREEKKRSAVFILLVPLTIFSIIFALEIALFGTKILTPETLTLLVNDLGSSGFIKKFIYFTPLWMCLHGILTLLITTELRISFTINKETYHTTENE